MIFRVEGDIPATLWVATTKGTITLIQSKEYLQTQFLPDLGMKDEKLSIWLAKLLCYGKQTQRNLEELPQLIELWLAEPSRQSKG